jgi:hypothetical protein
MWSLATKMNKNLKIKMLKIEFSIKNFNNINDYNDNIVYTNHYK